MLRIFINNSLFFRAFSPTSKNTLNGISTSSVQCMKKIEVEQEKKSLVVSGQYIESPREQLLMKEVRDKEKRFCPKCTLGLDVKHTDVLILSQYLRSDGCMLPSRITGLCRVQQKRMGKLVTMAQKAGLMPNFAPAKSKRDPTNRYGWKKFNKYFDEDTIKFRGKFIK